MFSFEMINQIKKKVNLLELVKEYEPEIKEVGVNLWACCCPHPDHDDEKPSFRIWLNKDKTWSWACMGCHVGEKTVGVTNSNEEKNYGSDAIAFVRWITDYKGSPHVLSFREAVISLADRVGERDLIVTDDKNVQLLKMNKSIAKGYHAALNETVRSYLYERGLSDEDINEWQIGLANFKDYSLGTDLIRVTFPLFSKKGDVVGFSSRALPSDEERVPKYINSANSPTFNKKFYLYNLHKLDVSTCKEIRITEGVFDVILAHKYGVKNVVSTLGTALTEEHVKLIKKLNLTPVLCMDGDEAGRKGIARALSLLAKEKIFAKVFLLPQGEDLASLASVYKDRLEDLIAAQAKPYWKYYADAEVEKYENIIAELRTKMLPDLIALKETCTSKEEYLAMKSFIKERVGLLIE